MGEARRRKKLDPNYGKSRKPTRSNRKLPVDGYYPEDYDFFMESAEDCCADLISQSFQLLKDEALAANERGCVFVEMSDFYENLIDILRGKRPRQAESQVKFNFVAIDSLCKDLAPEALANKKSLPNKVCPILSSYDLSAQFQVLFNFANAADFYDNDCYFFASVPLERSI